VALVAQTTAFVYIYVGIPQIAEMTLSSTQQFPSLPGPLGHVAGGAILVDPLEHGKVMVNRVLADRVLSGLRCGYVVALNDFVILQGESAQYGGVLGTTSPHTGKAERHRCLVLF
jgi:hypothetical protein